MANDYMITSNFNNLYVNPLCHVIDSYNMGSFGSYLKIICISRYNIKKSTREILYIYNIYFLYNLYKYINLILKACILVHILTPFGELQFALISKSQGYVIFLGLCSKRLGNRLLPFKDKTTGCRWSSLHGGRLLAVISHCAPECLFWCGCRQYLQLLSLFSRFEETFLQISLCV